MKKLFFATICAAAILATSCEKSFDDVAVGGDKAVTLSVNIGLPEISTRAFADGTKATELQYAVYEVTAETGLTKIDNEEYCGKTEINLHTKLSFTLLKDHKYGLVFWAAPKDDSPYEVEFEDDGATMSYNKTSLSLNSDNNDAFYAYQEVTVTGDGSVSVKLTRPFAQINIGTNDFDKAETLGITPKSLTSYIQVPASGSLNLVTGEVETSATASTVRFEGGVPDDEDYPVKGYEYLAMAYVLVGAEQETTIDIEFGYSSTGVETTTTRKIGSVPVRRNYRTNIYGALLTSSLDANVDIEPDTDGDKKVMLDWDGVSMKQPAYDEENKTYTVNGADELAWLASQPDNSFENETIVLENDLNLAGKEFTAFASGAQRSGSGLAANSNSFKGVFDGNGKTIRGFKATAVSNKNEAAAFISNISGEAVVKDVTFENVEIVSTTAEQAGIVGIVSGGAKVEGVKVMGGKISSVEAAGGIVGRILGQGTVKDCENHADVSTKDHNVGGIVGAAYYNNEGMSITGCDNYGNISGKYAAGGIIGLSCGDVSGCNNYGTSVTGQAASVGGVVGEQKGSGKITGCTNKANVSGGAESSGNYGCGGIVGWVRYTTEQAYTNQSAIVVSGCTNEGKHIVGAAGVGGIVGVWYSDGECKENINMAETITANGSFAAGIVGNSQWTEVDSEGGTKEAHTEGLKLTVHDNVSYTAENDIKANDCTHLYVYINDSSRTTENDNTNPSMTTVSSPEDFQSAFEDIKDGDIIVLSNGDFDGKSVTWPKDVAITIKGNGADKSSITDIGYVKTDGSSLTIEDITLKVESQGSATSIGFEGAKSVSLKNVTVLGEFHTKTAAVTVENCKFYFDDINTKDRYGLWIYGCQPAVVKDCVFKVVPPSGNDNETKAILINYNDTNADHKYVMGDVTVENCKFEAGLESAKAAIEIHSENFSSAGTLTIKNCTYDDKTYKGGLWREIYNKQDDSHEKGQPTTFYTVYVDGEQDSKN